MEMAARFLIAVATLALSGAYGQRPEIHRIQRFENPRTCGNFEVCADIFNMTRTMEDGSKQPEIRVLLNCRCPVWKRQCATEETIDQQFIFRETTVQGQVICEGVDSVQQCLKDDVAKEEHENTDRETFDRIIYQKIKCACPNNDHPARGFYNRATVTQRTEYNDEGNSIRPFKCRNY